MEKIRQDIKTLRQIYRENPVLLLSDMCTLGIGGITILKFFTDWPPNINVLLSAGFAGGNMLISRNIRRRLQLESNDSNS